MHLRLHLPLAYLSYKLGLFFSFFLLWIWLIKTNSRYYCFWEYKNRVFSTMLVLLQKKDRSRPVTNHLPKALPLRDVAIGLDYSGLSAQRCAKVYWQQKPNNWFYGLHFELFRLKAYYILAQGRVLKWRRLGQWITPTTCALKGQHRLCSSIILNLFQWGNDLYNLYFLCCPFRAPCYICSHLPKALPLRDVAIGLCYFGFSVQRSARQYWSQKFNKRFIVGKSNNLFSNLLYEIFRLKAYHISAQGRVLKGQRLGII